MKMNGVDITELDRLCNNYGLPKDSTSNYFLLADVYTAKKKGMYYTDAEISGDDRTIDLANMLRRISGGSGRFAIAGNSYEYGNKDFIEGLRQYLTDELLKRVDKVPECNYLWLSVGFGRGGSQGRAFKIIVPNGDILSEDEGFSNAELKAIIDKGKELKSFVGMSEGRVQKFYDEGNHTFQAELGSLAKEFLQGLPDNWTLRKRLCFVADFMRISGFLDKRGDDYLYDFDNFKKERKEKEIQNWLNAFKKKAADLGYCQ